MDGDRDALIIATGTYADRGLRRLRAPAQDARALAGVLGDPAIGNFRVQQVIDQPAHLLRRAIEQFFADRDLLDLLLVHLSCHGIKDDAGRLYFAATDTQKRLLHSSAVSAAELNELMEHCRARSIVLLLDCCYSGAFLPGSKGDGGVHLKEKLEGRGRAILTATNAIEYAWEGEALSGQGQPSVFTAAIVEGIATGEADRDRDGVVSIHDLYKHVDERVRATKRGQTPLMWALAVQHDLYVARAPTDALVTASDKRTRGRLRTRATRARLKGLSRKLLERWPRLGTPPTRRRRGARAAALIVAGVGGLLWGSGRLSPPAPDCSIHNDRKLHCGNVANANVYLLPTYQSPVSGIMLTTYSWFNCWQHGQVHRGDNDIWYWTQGDVGQHGHHGWGFMSASDMKTTVNPAPGLAQCPRN
jgi:hypothetical protein